MESNIDFVEIPMHGPRKIKGIDQQKAANVFAKIKKEKRTSHMILTGKKSYFQCNSGQDSYYEKRGEYYDVSVVTAHDSEFEFMLLKNKKNGQYEIFQEQGVLLPAVIVDSLMAELASANVESAGEEDKQTPGQIKFSIDEQMKRVLKGLN